MFAELAVLAWVQLGPFFEQREDYLAVRPVYAREGEVTDVCWPFFTAHDDWWRFMFLAHYQNYGESGDQFLLLPFWFSGHDRAGGFYWGLAPFYGRHPHFLLFDDLEFAFWPLWTSFSTPRPSENRMMRTRCVCWPFVNWRDDGSWAAWPFYGFKRQRESEHRYVCWPFVTWADYAADRDTTGAGSSFMVWPFFAKVDRERERQWMVLPPFVSVAETPYSKRVRCPWPFIDYEKTPARRRLSVWPFYERDEQLAYKDQRVTSSVTRFGWKLVELYGDETRVFPFLASRRDGSFFRLWPFYESDTGADGIKRTRVLALDPIRHTPQVDRSFAKFWSFYECQRCDHAVRHSLFWNLIHWTTRP